MPFAGYSSFEDCVTKNKDKSDAKAYCASIMHKAEDKEIKFTTSDISIKEEKGTFFSEGFIATTHPDRDAKPKLGTHGDILSEKVIDKIVNTLKNPAQSGHPEASQVSYRHDYVNENNPELPPAGVNNTVEKRRTQDGHWGAYVKTEHTTTFPEKDKLIYEVEKKIIPGYSIEYNTTDYDIVNLNGKEYRFIKDADFRGYSFANGRKIANPMAEITACGYKEMIDSFTPISHDSKKEPEVKMADEKQAPEIKEEKKEVIESKESVANEIKEKIIAEIKAELKEVKPENPPIIEAKEKIENKEVEMKELKEYRENVFGAKKASISQQWMNAHKLVKRIEAEGKELKYGNKHTTSTPFEVKEGKIELKDLTTDDNPAYSTNSYYTSATTYTQTPTEFNDIYGPVIINQLSEAVVAWNKIPAEDQSGYSTATFRVKDAANSTVSSTNSFQSHGSTPTWDGNTGRTKYMIPFVTSYGEIKVEDEEMELSNSPGGIGNIYEREVQDVTTSWISAMNKYFLTGTTAVSESIPYGLQKTLIASGSLYGRDVGSYTLMAVGGYDDMSTGPITLKKMRDMVDTVVMNGADEGSLFFIGKQTQVTKIKTLIQKSQVIIDKSARIGFEGLPMLDTTPIFADKDCDSDDLFLLEQKSWKKMIKKAPTYVEFAKTSLHRKGIVWMMFNIGCTNPNHNYWIYNLQTT